MTYKCVAFGACEREGVLQRCNEIVTVSLLVEIFPICMFFCIRLLLSKIE